MKEPTPKSRKEAQGTQFAKLYDTPSHWPREVRIVPWGEMGNLGHDPRTNQLFWDGNALVTQKRFSNFERSLAVVGLAIAGIGVLATVAQAVIAWLEFSKGS